MNDDPTKLIDSFTNEFDFLSNFYGCDIAFEEKKYPSSEHAFQAAKTFDKSERENIRRANTPGIAKKLGRKLSLRKDWESVRDGIMLDILRIKFNSHPDLAQKLLDTGDAKLVEGNWWNDTYWGVCDGVGKNKLGITLMQVRDEIRNKKC